MGSSKKHKEKDKDRESKKKRKHRSRSRSQSKEKERKKRRRDRSRSRSRDRGKSPTQANYSSRDRAGHLGDADEEYLYSKSRDRPESVQHQHSKEVFDYNHQKSEKETKKDEPPKTDFTKEGPASGDGSSLSIQETNRLRAKLGLKPLEGSDTNGEDGKPKKTEGVHAPPINLSEKKKTEKLKEKMANRKLEREIKSKLGKVKGLGDSDSDDDGARAWVSKSRKQQKERDLAAKRAKMLEEMDQDFGIGNLVENEFQATKDRKNAYTAQDLSGLRVEHGLDKFKEGRNVILTLKDRGILDSDEEGDTLVNVNIEDVERAEKNVDNKKKKPDYKPYDEPEYDEYGMVKSTSMLEKYDEEIDGEKKESFTLGTRGSYDAAHEKRMVEIRKDLKARGDTLLMPKPILASEYMTPEEMKAASFRKTKKKVRKIRKKDKALKADDLLALAEDPTTIDDFGSRARGRGRQEVMTMEEGELEDDVAGAMGGVAEAAFSTDLASSIARPPPPPPGAPPIMIKPPLPDMDDSDMMGPDEDLTGVDVEEEEAMNEMHNMLAKARKLKLKKERKAAPIAAAVTIKPEEGASGSELLEMSNITLNSTSEFCRNLGEIPTYGLSGNRDEDRDELMDQELEAMEQRRKDAEQEETTGGWNEVDVDETPVDIKKVEAPVLEEEPIVSDGIGAALRLASKKGFLEDEEPGKARGLSKKVLDLMAQNYTIQDKRYEDLDDKNRKRDRYSGGMTSEFKDKDGYIPYVKLDYVDEGGRALSAKEAFRQLSHRFHGKGSGKKKTEKRGKKVEEELLMKQMSSTDTPLNTLSLLQDKQRTEQSPFIVLSGGSRGFSSQNHSISKPK